MWRTSTGDEVQHTRGNSPERGMPGLASLLILRQVLGLYLAEITFKREPENMDCGLHQRAQGHMQLQTKKLLEEEEKLVQKQREDEELNNLMNVLENHTKDSKLEMEVLENLQDLKDLNQWQVHEVMLLQHCLSQEQWQQQQEEEDKCETTTLLEEARHQRLLEDSNSENEAPPYHKTQPHSHHPQGTKDEEESRGPVQQSTVSRLGCTKEGKDGKKPMGAQSRSRCPPLVPLKAGGDQPYTPDTWCPPV